MMEYQSWQMGRIITCIDPFGMHCLIRAEGGYIFFRLPYFIRIDLVSYADVFDTLTDPCREILEVIY